MVSDRFAARGIPRRSSIARMASARSFALVAARRGRGHGQQRERREPCGGRFSGCQRRQRRRCCPRRARVAWRRHGAGQAHRGRRPRPARHPHVASRPRRHQRGGAHRGGRRRAGGRAARRQQQDRAPRQRRHRDPRAPHFHLLARALRPARTSPLERSARPHGSGRRLRPRVDGRDPPSTAPPRRWPRFEVGSC